MLASPIVANGKIYVGTDEGKFLAFGNMPELAPEPMPETSSPPTPAEPVEFLTSPIVVVSVAAVVVGTGLLVYFKKRKY